MTLNTENKTDFIGIKCSPNERAEIEAGAREARLPISTWSRSVLLRAAEAASKRADATEYGSESWIEERIREAS